MKFTVFFFILSFNTMADVYLQSGDSTYVRGDTVHCGLRNSEQQYRCTYSACLRSASILNITQLACKTHNGYQTYSKSVWADSGSEAESKIQSMLSSDSDVTDYQFGSISCN